MGIYPPTKKVFAIRPRNNDKNSRKRRRGSASRFGGGVRYLSQAKPKELRGTALVRLDFNTEDDWRLRSALPTLQLLRKHALRVVVISHKGRPTRASKAHYSLRSDAKKLSRLLRVRVAFIPCPAVAMGEARARLDLSRAKEIIDKLPKHSVVLLENLRFDAREETNSPAFAKALARLGDYYVNDAFSVSHRANASVDAVTRYVKRAYAGLVFEQEVAALSRVMKNEKSPLVVIVGGAKIKEKLDLLSSFKQKAYALLVGGGAANTLLALRGVDVGTSLREDRDPRLRRIAAYRNLHVPVDWNVHRGKILDIGPRTCEEFTRVIQKARTIIWNGPMGYIEHPRFSAGTRCIIRAIVKNRRAFSVVGGGETVMFLKRYGYDKKPSFIPPPSKNIPRSCRGDEWASYKSFPRGPIPRRKVGGFISTGGGAMLEFLAGKKLPGIEALKRK